MTDISFCCPIDTPLDSRRLEAKASLLMAEMLPMLGSPPARTNEEDVALADDEAEAALVTVDEDDSIFVEDDSILAEVTLR